MHHKEENKNKRKSILCEMLPTHLRTDEVKPKRYKQVPKVLKVERVNYNVTKNNNFGGYITSSKPPDISKKHNKNFSSNKSVDVAYDFNENDTIPNPPSFHLKPEYVNDIFNNDMTKDSQTDNQLEQYNTDDEESNIFQTGEKINNGITVTEPDLDHEHFPIDFNSEDTSSSKKFSCCTSCRNENQIIIRKLNELSELMKSYTLTHSIQRYEPDFSILPDFPLMTIAKVEGLGEHTKTDNNVFNSYKEKISTLGGVNSDTAVRNCLRLIMSDNVAIKYSWTGLKKTIKLSDYLIVKGISDVIMKQFKTTKSQIDNCIKGWLRHAGDRVRYQIKKDMECTANKVV
ncbi:uncharacterized protein [Prorops nasuta]|uniref:uncharacterized protein n=1 Tax=Prorops nasuta TaxID=863751 RepID=UPI0034CF5C54